MVLHVRDFECILAARVIRREFFGFQIFRVLHLIIKLIPIALDIAKHAHSSKRRLGSV